MGRARALWLPFAVLVATTACSGAFVAGGWLGGSTDTWRGLQVPSRVNMLLGYVACKILGWDCMRINMRQTMMEGEFL